MQRRRITLLCLPMLAALALCATGCGGADPAPAAGTPERPLVASAEEDAAGGGRSNEAAPAERSGEAVPGYEELVENQVAKPRERFTPCNLVRLGRAADIVGAKLAAPVEAPQGPTCIYRSEAGRQALTVSVQALDLAAFRRTLHRPAKLAVGDRTAYCIRRGQPMLWVGVAPGRVLSVGAACDVAQRFAAEAVRRLDA